MAADPWTDRAALRRQYGSPANLATRVGLYGYLVPDPGMDVASFEGWVLDHLDWRGDEAVLDVGRGAGSYEAALVARAGRVVGLDLSPGMLAHRVALPPGRLAAADAQRLPVADGVVDVVLAAHMLYHVPDIARAVREARRVLRPGGTALLVANGSADKREVRELWQEAAEVVGASFAPPGSTLRFDVDTAGDLVGAVFGDVQVDVLTGEFRFPAPEPVLAWVDSLRDGTGADVDDVAWAAVSAELRARIERRIAADGAFVVTKSSGVIVAR